MLKCSTHVGINKSLAVLRQNNSEYKTPKLQFEAWVLST